MTNLIISLAKKAASLFTGRKPETMPSDQTFNPGSWTNEAAVQTKYGLLKGFTDKGPTWCWKGIPYAAPPVGPLRWKAPRDPNPWLGTRSARKFSSAAAQILPVIGATGSEDCLYLNIWRSKSAETRLPVYLYIHGGGNSIGTARTRDYYGIAVAKKSNLLYVSLNFRLGVLGWFRHPAVTGSGSPEDQSGNFATLDLIKALEWVRDNIAAFGGDPKNVTIAGESGGAMNVLSLLTAPGAKGLFHRAVSESGLSLIWTKDIAEEQSDKLLLDLLIADRKARDAEEAAEIAAQMTGVEINDYLRAKSPTQLIKSIPTRDFGMANWRTIYTDGVVLPEEGYRVFASGTWANKVPLIIGCNKDEMKLFGFIRKNPARGTRLYDLLYRYRSLLWRASGLDSIAMHMTSRSDAPPVYAYRFDWGSPDETGSSVLPGKMGVNLGAYHFAEVSFFLGMGMPATSTITGIPFTRRNRPGRKKLTALCMSYLANFARTGDPNGEKLPRWSTWGSTEGADKLLILDADNEDLKLSHINEVITLKAVLDIINAELKEPELGEVLKLLKGPLPFGIEE